MNKQQTAVEWLIEQFTNLQNGVFNGFPVLSLDEVFKQAKEMEKQQSINFMYDFNHDHLLSIGDGWEHGMAPEAYYDEYFEQQEEPCVRVTMRHGIQEYTYSLESAIRFVSDFPLHDYRLVKVTVDNKDKYVEPTVAAQIRLEAMNGRLMLTVPSVISRELAEALCYLKAYVSFYQTTPLWNTK